MNMRTILGILLFMPIFLISDEFADKIKALHTRYAVRYDACRKEGNTAEQCAKRFNLPCNDLKKCEDIIWGLKAVTKQNCLQLGEESLDCVCGTLLLEGLKEKYVPLYEQAKREEQKQAEQATKKRKKRHRENSPLGRLFQRETSADIDAARECRSALKEAQKSADNPSYAFYTFIRKSAENKQ